MEWQSIETAPKDGTHILIFAEGVITEASWNQKHSGWFPVTLDIHGCGCCGGSLPKPRVWIQRPKDPVSGIEQK